MSRSQARAPEGQEKMSSKDVALLRCHLAQTAQENISDPMGRRLVIMLYHLRKELKDEH